MDEGRGSIAPSYSPAILLLRDVSAIGRRRAMHLASTTTYYQVDTVAATHTKQGGVLLGQLVLYVI